MNYYFKKWIEKKYFSIPGNLAIYDQLTGLYNFNWFEKIGKSKYLSRDVYITMIDLNDFKKINDTKGHEYANQVLQDVGTQLARASELDPEADVMRYGGDEFVIFSNIDFGAKISSENNPIKNLISYGTYHKNSYEGLTTSMAAADDIMYTYKKKFKESLASRNKYNLCDIDLDKWQQIYHIIYNLLFGLDDQSMAMSIRNFNDLRRYIINNLTEEQYAKKALYIEQINKMEPLYEKNYCKEHPIRTIHKFRSTLVNAMIDKIKKED